MKKNSLTYVCENILKMTESGVLDRIKSLTFRTPKNLDEFVENIIYYRERQKYLSKKIKKINNKIDACIVRERYVDITPEKIEEFLLAKICHYNTIINKAKQKMHMIKIPTVGADSNDEDYYRAIAKKLELLEKTITIYESKKETLEDIIANKLYNKEFKLETYNIDIYNEYLAYIGKYKGHKAFDTHNMEKTRRKLEKDLYRTNKEYNLYRETFIPKRFNEELVEREVRNHTSR